MATLSVLLIQVDAGTVTCQEVWETSAIANISALQILQHQKNNTEVIFTTLQTHAMITISSENFFSPNTSIAVRLSSRVSISETKSDMKNNKIFKMEENAYDKQTATVFPYDSDERTTNGRDRGKTKTKINFL